MADAQTRLSLDDPGVRPVTGRVKALKLFEGSDESGPRSVRNWEDFLTICHDAPPDTTRDPTYADYAKILVNGTVVAEIDNHGWVKSSNAVGGKISHGLPASAGGHLSGPALAQARAEYVAGLLGGEVAISATAMTQSEFDAARQPCVGGDAGTSDTLLLAQELAQATADEPGAAACNGASHPDDDQPGSADAPVTDAEAADRRDPVQEFLDYMRKTPEELYHEAILREMGLTQEELEAMPPEQRVAIEREIQEKLEERIAKSLLEDEQTDP